MLDESERYETHCFGDGYFECMMVEIDECPHDFDGIYLEWNGGGLPGM